MLYFYKGEYNNEEEDIIHVMFCMVGISGIYKSCIVGLYLYAAYGEREGV